MLELGHRLTRGDDPGPPGHTQAVAACLERDAKSGHKAPLRPEALATLAGFAE